VLLDLVPFKLTEVAPIKITMITSAAMMMNNRRRPLGLLGGRASGLNLDSDSLLDPENRRSWFCRIFMVMKSSVDFQVTFFELLSEVLENLHTISIRNCVQAIA